MTHFTGHVVTAVLSRREPAEDGGAPCEGWVPFGTGHGSGNGIERAEIVLIEAA